ncbi:hypothetical protein FSP39_017495 [Pinctada imbricata]|uniref:Uncharacterized protein n=1 Tax=Pinctada imbricata TaxID=66713 RepID=A0AA88XZI8_PINIB|nr:hypothetical protein FSP39_017495 [Pinctada imbricata]
MNACSGSEEKPAPEVPKKKSSIQSAMDKLRTEMVSLMDQDLCLMRQLLTLNEAIEDIKTKRLYGMSKNSLHADSRDMSASEWSLSDTDLYASDADIEKSAKTLETQKDTSIPVPKSTTESNFVKTDILVNGKPLHCVHGVQRSIDSGYDESDTYQTDIEVSL